MHLGWFLWEAALFLVLCLLATPEPQILAPLEPALSLLGQPRPPGEACELTVFPSPLPDSSMSPDMNTEVRWKSVVHPLPSRIVTETAKEPWRSHIQHLLTPHGLTPACVPGPENRDLVSRRTAGWWVDSNLASETGDKRV